MVQHSWRGQACDSNSTKNIFIIPYEYELFTPISRHEIIQSTFSNRKCHEVKRTLPFKKVVLLICLPINLSEQYIVSVSFHNLRYTAVPAIKLI